MLVSKVKDIQIYKLLKLEKHPKDINYTDIIKGCKNSLPEGWMCTQQYGVMEAFVDKVRSFQKHQDRCGWRAATQMVTHVYYG